VLGRSLVRPSFGAGPRIFRSFSYKSGIHRIVFDVGHDAVHLVIVSEPVDVRLPLPEGFAGAGQKLVGLPRGCSLQPLEYATWFLFRAKQDVNVVGHDNEGSQILRPKTLFAAAFKNLYNEPGHFWMS
jgi:hypothetical protein